MSYIVLFTVTHFNWMLDVYATYDPRNIGHFKLVQKFEDGLHPGNCDTERILEVRKFYILSQCPNYRI